jgi:hypothetical protein
MNLVKVFLVVGFMNTPLIVFAQKTGSTEKPKIIDLGDMDVQGELRRPTLFMIESSKKLQGQVEKAAGRKWNSFEKSLLTPTEETIEIERGSP